MLVGMDQVAIILTFNIDKQVRDALSTTNLFLVTKHHLLKEKEKRPKVFILSVSLTISRSLQISSVRDISRSSTADTSAGSNNRRLLRFSLTDGHSQITAIEYSHIPSIADDVVPGTKVFVFSFSHLFSYIACSKLFLLFSCGQLCVLRVLHRTEIDL